MARREEERRYKEKVGGGGLYSRGVVRTRGFVAPSVPPGTGDGPVRTRGAVRTAGTAVELRPWEKINASDLKSLLDELREALERFPLCIVVDNPQLSDSQIFIACLGEGGLLGPDDALWVIGDGNYEDTISAELRSYISEYAYLNRQDKEQRELADTFVPDLLFTGDTSAAALKERLTEWEGRVWAVIIAGPDDFDPSALGLTLGIPGEHGDPWRLRWSEHAVGGGT